MKTQKLICLFFIVHCFACTSNKLNKIKIKKLSEEEKQAITNMNFVSKCQESWHYKDVQESIFNAEVLLFNPKTTIGMFFPNFIIIKTAINDTLGLLDKDFEGTLKPGDLINIEQEEWSKDDKEYIKPLRMSFKEQEKNKLYCSVKSVYRGKISKVIK